MRFILAYLILLGSLACSDGGSGFVLREGGSNECGFGFNRNKYKSRKLNYTRHAECRSQCRNISNKTIENVFEQGHLNCKKSDPASQKYAIEGRDPAGNKIRIVVADQKDHYNLVTVINLDKEDGSDCALCK